MAAQGLRFNDRFVYCCGLLKNSGMQIQYRLKTVCRASSTAFNIVVFSAGVACFFVYKGVIAVLVIECRGLFKRFAEQEVLCGVDWQVNYGEKWGLIGRKDCYENR